MARRQPGHLRSPEATAFYPQHAPQLEAPYIRCQSSPNLPYAQDTGIALRRQKHAELTSKETALIEKRRMLRKQQTDQRIKQERLDTINRMKADKAKREERWTQKTAANPFAVDQWKEDEDIYKLNRLHDTRTQDREAACAKAKMQDNMNRCRAKIADVDMLGNLRLEKKRLQEEQKYLKARLGMDQVEQRCTMVDFKLQAKKEAHEVMLASRGHLDRCVSDFFTDERLSTKEREDRATAKAPRFARSAASWFANRDIQATWSSVNAKESGLQSAPAGQSADGAELDVEDFDRRFNDLST